MNKTRQVSPGTILYARLSRDDDLEGDSGSIVNQRRLLEEYAEKNGFVPYSCVCDDGYSGVAWDRPGWQKIMAEIEAGNVQTIVVKNLDRMGRDYLRVGLYMEMFREKGVRLIAVNDGLDTACGEDDFTPFRAILAEWYARDTSRKIRSVFQKKGRDGKPMCHTPIYGFKKDPQDKDVWVVDEEAAAVVRRIFQMTVDGAGPFLIAKALAKERIERPSYYLWRAGIHATSGRCNPDLPYGWRGNVIAKMLQQREYMGDLVNFKCHKPSFKDKKVYRNAPGDRLVFEGALPAIVCAETWELAQKLRKTRRVSREGCLPNPLTGLLYCADCGGKMSNRRNNYTEDREGRPIGCADTYECSTYRKSMARQVKKCSIHYIRSVVVRERILDTIRRVSAYVRENEAEFTRKVREDSEIRREETARARRKQMDRNTRRIEELEALFSKVYEDHAAGRLSDGRYEQLSGEYERTLVTLGEENEEIQAGLEAFRADNIKVGSFIEIVRRYTDLSELTTPMLNEFVDKVLVYNPDKSSGERTQRLDIYLRHIGLFDLPPVERTQEEIDAEERRLAKKRRQQEYYRRRCVGSRPATAVDVSGMAD